MLDGHLILPNIYGSIINQIEFNENGVVTESDIIILLH